MPTRERCVPCGRARPGGDQSHNQRQHREAMARKTSPQNVAPEAVRVPTSSPRSGTMPIGIRTMTRRRVIARAGCCRARTSGFHRLGDRFGRLRRWRRGERWVQTPRRRDRGSAGDLRAAASARCGGGLAPVRSISTWPRPGWRAAIEENIGHGNTRRGRRHPDRARRANPDRRPHPRHRGARPRPHRRRQRAEGRSAAFRHRAADGTASRREPQSGRCRTCGPDYAGRHRHGFDRRQCQAARDRRAPDRRPRAGRVRIGAAAVPAAPPPLAGPTPRLPRRLRAAAERSARRSATGSTA